MKKWILILAVLLLVILIIIFLADLFYKRFYPYPVTIRYGVTFSPKYANDLKLDWKQVYIRMLDELQVRRFRLPTYWDTIEPQPQKYDFSSTDFMLDEAQKRGAKVILTLGIRQYRWPECYSPYFVKSLNQDDRKTKTLDFIKAVVERYKSNDAITAWEVENEPLLEDFGECDKADISFLKKEVELVKKLDKRPIILTDSGELGWWITSMKLSDIFGTTVYRTVHTKFFGLIDYPSLPYFYNMKSHLVRTLFAPNNQKTIIIELQAEPWSPGNNLAATPVKKQQELFSKDKFKQNLNFARQIGFDEIYLWGVEWWYFMEKKEDPSYLDYAKTLFLKSPNL